MTRNNQVGFSQRLQLAWLEQTAALLLAGYDRDAIKAALETTLQDELSIDSQAKGSNRSKAISNLLNIWVSVEPPLTGLRDDGLILLQRTPHSAHLPLHWGMSMAAYPFFGHVASTVGRLLELQDTVAAGQVQRRLREEFGQRETVSRAGRRILRCFIDWGVLQDTETRGVYRPAPQKPVEDAAMVAWLVEAVLLASDSQTKPLQALLQSTALYPFSLNPSGHQYLIENKRLELFRQGLDTDMIALRGA